MTTLPLLIGSFSIEYNSFWRLKIVSFVLNGPAWISDTPGVQEALSSTSSEEMHAIVKIFIDSVVSTINAAFLPNGSNICEAAKPHASMYIPQQWS